MPKIAIEANELTQVQVSHISLVKRGANKVPFRVLKSDGGTEMIQFKNLGNVFSKSDKTPMVAAILVSKDADLDAVKARIEKAGFSVEKQTDTDGAVIFAQGEFTDMPEDNKILKIDSDVAVVMANVTKAFEPMNLESTSFGEVFAQEGLVPGFRLAVEALSDTFHNVLAKAEKPEDLTTDITKIIGEFADHMNLLAKAVPSDAFSLDFFKGDTVKAPAKKAKSDEEVAAELKATEDAAAALKATEDAATEAKAKLVADAGDDPAKLQAIAAEDNQAVLLKALGALGDNLGETQAEIKALGTRIAKVEETSTETKDALKKTAAGKIESDDDDPLKNVQKRDVTKDPPLIDTAYDRSLSRKATPDAQIRH